MNPDPQPDNAQLDATEGGTVGAGIDWSDPNSPLAPLYMTVSGVLWVVVLGLVLVIFGVYPLWHTDFWSHLKYGERISADRALPTREPFCPFTDKDQRFFEPHWLTQVGYHGLFRLGSVLSGGDGRRQLEGGVELIRLAHLLAVLTALFLLALAYLRISGSPSWGVGGMALVVILMLGQLVVQRPQTIAFACYAAVLCGVSRPVIGLRALVAIPLVLVLWANLHGSFVVGVALLAVLWLGRLIEIFREHGHSIRAVWCDPVIRRLSVVGVLALIGTGLLTPYGVSLYPDVVHFSGNPNLRTVAEWQPLNFSQPRGGHWGYLAVLAILALTQVASPRPVTATQFLLVLTFGVWPLFQERAMAWWIPLVPWILAPHWVAIVQQWGLGQREVVPNFRRTALAVVIGVVAVILSPASSWLKTGQPRPLPAALHRGTPADIAATLNGDVPADPARVKELIRVIKEWHGGRYTGRVFSSEIQGDFLLWALPPETPVMMFNHAPLFAAAYWQECLRVKAGGSGWWEFLDRYRVGVVVIEADMNSNLCDELRTHPAWLVVVDEATAPAANGLSRLFVAVRKPAPRGGP